MNRGELVLERVAAEVELAVAPVPSERPLYGTLYSAYPLRSRMGPAWCLLVCCP